MSSTDTTNLSILQLKEKINTVKKQISEMVKMDKTNIEIEMYFLENETQLYENYPYLIKKLIKGGPMDFLDKMLENLEKVENGEQTKASTELKLGEELAQQFLYPIVNNNSSKE